MDCIKNMNSNFLTKCKDLGIEIHSNEPQTNKIGNEGWKISDDKDLKNNLNHFDDLVTEKNINKEDCCDKTALVIIHKPDIYEKAIGTINSSNCNNFENMSTDSYDVEKSNISYTEINSQPVNKNYASIKPNEVDTIENFIDKPDEIDKNVNLNEECIASVIDLDKKGIVDISIAAAKNECHDVWKTETELTDKTHNKDELNESITSDSILIDIDLDVEYYFDHKNDVDKIKDTEECKMFQNLQTELERTCINYYESSNNTSKINKEPSTHVGEPENNINNDYKHVSNTEMLVSLEEFDRILQRYNNDNKKVTHWDPNDSVIFDENLKDPLSIDEVDEFISNLNETQPNITQSKDLVVIEISKGIDSYDTNSQSIYESQNNINDIGIKDDVISISSEEHTEQHNECYDYNNKDTISITSSESDCSGYHSSDFEFISEREAELDGLIINFVQPKVNKTVTRFGRPNIIRNSNKDLTPGPSNLSNRGNTSNNQDTCKIITINEGYRPIHEIPQGDNYLNLFQGIYNPALSNSSIYFLENKSVRVTGMHVEFDGLGFDRQMAERRSHNDSDDEFKEEAQESLKKIISMYPCENKKRRRRF